MYQHQHWFVGIQYAQVIILKNHIWQPRWDVRHLTLLQLFEDYFKFPTLAISLAVGLTSMMPMLAAEPASG